MALLSPCLPECYVGDKEVDMQRQRALMEALVADDRLSKSRHNWQDWYVESVRPDVTAHPSGTPIRNCYSIVLRRGIIEHREERITIHAPESLRDWVDRILAEGMSRAQPMAAHEAGDAGE